MRGEAAMAGRLRRRASLGSVGIAALLAAAACGGDGQSDDQTAVPSPSAVISAPAATPTPSPSISIPSSLSPEESEAVTKAIEAYTQWVAALDKVAQTGGADLSDLESIAAQAALIAGKNEAALYAQRGWHSDGHRIIRRIEVDRVSLLRDAETSTVPEVTLISCVDSSHVVVLDKAETSVIKDLRRVFEAQTWVRYYPQSEYPQVGKGVDGWVVGQYRNKEVESC